MIKKLFLFAAAFSFLVASTVRAEEFGFDKAHTHIGFSIRHLFTPVTGEFTDFDGTVSFDPKNPTDAKVDVTIQADSINTDNTMRDHHLKTAAFFDVAKYPTLRFKSTKVTAEGNNQFKMDGLLTMHGITKPVVLDVDYIGSDLFMGFPVAGLTATTQIDRRDFGINWNQTLEGGSLMIGNTVTINLDIALMSKAGLEKMAKMMSHPKPAAASN